MNETPPRLPPEEPRQEKHNPAWGRAQRAWRRTVLPALLLCVAAMPAAPLLLEGRVENRLLLALACLGWLGALLCLLCGVNARCVRRHWACPACGQALPVRCAAIWLTPVYAAQCPACGCALEGRPESSDEPEDAPVPVPVPASRLAAAVGWLTAAYGLAGVLLSVLLVPQAAAGGAAAAVLNTVIFALGIAVAMLGRRPLPQAEDGRGVTVFETKAPLVLGLIFTLPGLGAAFCAMCLAVADGGLPPFFLVGTLSLVLLCFGLWMVLDYRNRRFVRKEDGTLLACNFLGRTRCFPPGSAACVRVQLPSGSLRVLDKDGKKLFAFELNMVNAWLLAGALEDAGAAVSLSPGPGADGMLAGGEGSPAVLDLDEREETWQHRHVRAICTGAWVLALAVCAACAVLFFVLLPVWGIRTVFLLIAVSPLLIYGYWFAFPQVLLWGEKPRYATAEWKKKHASVPFVLLFLELFLAMVFTAATSVLAVADPGRMFCLCALIGAALLGVCVLRIPRRLRNAGAVLSLVCCVLLLCWPLGYALNLACAGPTRHYEAQVVQQRVTFDEDDGEDSEPDYLLTVLLQDGRAQEVDVPASIYTLAQAGQPLRVCERSGIFGIRLIDVHK